MALHFVVKDGIAGIYSGDAVTYTVGDGFMIPHVVGIRAG